MRNYGTPELAGLTRHPNKATFYQDEGVAEGALVAISRALQDELEEFLLETTLLLVRPDAFVRKKGKLALGYIRAEGFFPLACRRIRMGPAMMRRFWFYQLNKASDDRIKLTEEISSQGDTLVVLLHDTRYGGEIPASLRLSEIKGSLSSKKRQSGHIRARLGMEGRTFGYIHTPDEPLDVVREFGVLFNTKELVDFVLEAASFTKRGSENLTVDAVAEAMDEETSFHSLDVTKTLAKAICDQSVIRNMREHADRGDCVKLESIRRAVIRDSLSSEAFWDYAVIASALITPDRKGISALIDNVSNDKLRREWRKSLSENTNPQSLLHLGYSR